MFLTMCAARSVLFAKQQNAQNSIDWNLFSVFLLDPGHRDIYSAI